MNDKMIQVVVEKMHFKKIQMNTSIITISEAKYSFD